MLQYRTEALTDAELEREREVAGGLAQSTRDLVDAVVRTTLPDEDLIEVRKQVDELTARLRSHQLPGSFGIAVTPEGTVRNHGNTVVGLRNAMAPPLRVQTDPGGRAWADFTLGAAYEGPPGMVHGGVTALLLDQLCGEAAAAGQSPGMTATLSMSYRRPTPLGPLHGEARVVRTEGVKTWVEGSLATGDGVTVECEGLFLLPSWAVEPAAWPKHVHRFE